MEHTKDYWTALKLAEGLTVVKRQRGALLAALEQIYEEEESRRKMCGNLSSQPLPKSIIQRIAGKAIAKTKAGD